MPKNKHKITVGILFGGKSPEHEISLLSAKNVVTALDKDKYQPLLIGIDKHGRWMVIDEESFLDKVKNVNSVNLEHITQHNAVTFIPHGRGKIINVHNAQLTYQADVVFPVLHGKFGEDGAIQGLLKIAEVPFVGASVLGSAIGMDKDVMKRLLRDANIPIAKFIVLHKQDAKNNSEKNSNKKNSAEKNKQVTKRLDYADIAKKIGSSFFIKPIDAGSSIGINKVTNTTNFHKAIQEAFQYADKIIVEECVAGREIECAVLGSNTPIATLPGEIVTQTKHEFYSYIAKYLDENGATLHIPAALPQMLNTKIKKLAIKTFQVLACEGLARVDMFLRSDDTLVVNEINTLPGFTAISMYPKLCEISGITYTQLVNTLIQLAIERFTTEEKLKTSYF